MIFLFNRVVFRFQPLIFPGCMLVFRGVELDFSQKNNVQLKNRSKVEFLMIQGGLFRADRYKWS